MRQQILGGLVLPVSTVNVSPEKVENRIGGSWCAAL